MKNGKTINEQIKVSFARPNNTTAYSINDVVTSNASLSVLNVTTVGSCKRQFVTIKSVFVKTNKVSIVPKFRIHLFNNINIDIPYDNALWKNIYQNKENYFGYIDTLALGSPSDTSNSNISFASCDPCKKVIRLDTNKSFYFVIETLTAFNPNANQIFDTVFTYEESEFLNEIEYNYVRA